MSEEKLGNFVDGHPENNNDWIPDPSPKYKEPTPSKSPIDDEESKQQDDLQPSPSENEPEKEKSSPIQLAPISESEARTWAMLAHLSVLLNLITGFLGGIAAIIIYFVYKDRSRLVAYHAMQSFIFQSITWLGSGLLAGLFFGFGSALAVFILPLLCLIPGFLFLLLLPVSLIYGVIGAIKVYDGEDFSYWQVGDWVHDILEPQPIARV